MKYESLDRDQALGDALADAGEPFDAQVNWAELQRAINAGAAPELARRRTRGKPFRLVMPASLAAGIALFLLVAGGHRGTLNDAPSTIAAIDQRSSIDALLDANLSDGQFRALVSGADDADELLAIAAGDGRP